ncbi:MAG: lamin tail domain-containing protein, partial [Myxococcales bacterium]|nr:lamin tail domain-containing protein [Myxococcales bacterium]
AVKDAFGNAIGAQYDSTTGFSTAAATACFGDVVLSYVYGGGGNSGAKYKNDFIELHNRSAVSVDLTGWSVQYAASAGTSWQVTPLSGSIAAGGYYLVQEAAGTGGTDSLPTPDATGTIAMSGSGAKVALVSSTTALSGSCPSDATIVDRMGYGSSASCPETAPTGGLSAVNGALRNDEGCTDTNDNSIDFTVASTLTNAPRNSASSAVACSFWCSVSESDTGNEADFCNVQAPFTLSATASATTATVYGRIYEAGVTEAAGDSGLVTAELGYGPTSVNPSTQSGWVWTPASFNIQSGNDDEYQATIAAPATPGTYAYAYRMSLDGGVSWTYCDINGSGTNAGLGFEVTQLGQLTVTP